MRRSPQPAARSPQPGCTRLRAAMRTARPRSCTAVYRAQPAAARLNSALSATTSAPLLCWADTSGCPNLPPSALRAPSPAGGGRTRLSPAPAARARWPASRCRCVVEYQRAVALFGRYGGCPNLPHPPFGHLPPPAGEGRGSALRLPLAGDGPPADVAASSSTSAPLLCSADTSGCPNLPPSALRAPSPAGGGRTRLSPAPAARGRWPASRCRCAGRRCPSGSA
ncbi:hypothetical protein FICKIIDM_02465 [Xanthomonas citri pv. punicae]|nr:hypothetical protein FICKIIDM_02465 [Xanthomonas citri pv. punicae]